MRKPKPKITTRTVTDRQELDEYLKNYQGHVTNKRSLIDGLNLPDGHPKAERLVHRRIEYPGGLVEEMYLESAPWVLADIFSL